MSAVLQWTVSISVTQLFIRNVACLQRGTLSNKRLHTTLACTRVPLAFFLSEEAVLERLSEEKQLF